MGRNCKNRASGEASESIYQEVTNRIIAELEEGRVPWVQPWEGAKANLGLPRNALTGRYYSGINILVLWCEVIEKGFASQHWLTFRQALELGGNVRKGERGTSICYADRFIPKAEIERAAEEGNDPRAIAFLKRFTVFNATQCDGLPEQFSVETEQMPEREIVPHAESLIAATGADFRIGGNRAYYVPSCDYIQVPPQPTFFDQINYYRTCFHELAHWTGADHRLARDLSAAFGSGTYAREELIAEMGSAFVCATIGIVPTVRHADYVGSWLKVLRENNRAIFRAASQASKAADYILEGSKKNDCIQLTFRRPG